MNYLKHKTFFKNNLKPKNVLKNLKVKNSDFGLRIFSGRFEKPKILQKRTFQSRHLKNIFSIRAISVQEYCGARILSVKNDISRYFNVFLILI